MKTGETARMPELPCGLLESTAETLRILAHPCRLRIIELLDLYGEQPVHELVGRLGINQGAVSGHLNKMKRAGLIAAARKGKEVWYGIANPDALTIISCIRKHSCGTGGTAS